MKFLNTFQLQERLLKIANFELIEDKLKFNDEQLFLSIILKKIHFIILFKFNFK